MSSPEEQIQKMLSDPYCQAFIEAMAEILVRHQDDQAGRLDEETEEMPAGEDDHLQSEVQERVL